MLRIYLYSGNAKLCEMLLKGGAKVNCQDPNGRTPLHMAAWSGFYGVAEKLIEYGADVNHVGLMGYTPLMTAAWKGHTSVLNLLLEKNALVDVVSTSDKATALNIAAQEGHEDVVRLLLNNNASLLADKYGRDPTKVAQQTGKFFLLFFYFTVFVFYSNVSQCGLLCCKVDTLQGTLPVFCNSSIQFSGRYPLGLGKISKISVEFITKHNHCDEFPVNIKAIHSETIS